jgi:hypothetical protein
MKQSINTCFDCNTNLLDDLCPKCKKTFGEGGKYWKLFDDGYMPKREWLQKELTRILGDEYDNSNRPFGSWRLKMVDSTHIGNGAVVYKISFRGHPKFAEYDFLLSCSELKQIRNIEGVESMKINTMNDEVHLLFDIYDLIQDDAIRNSLKALEKFSL